MTDLRGDAPSVWPNYAVSHIPGRLGTSIDAAFHSSSPVRPRAGQDHQPFAYGRYSHDEHMPFDRSPQHSAALTGSHSTSTYPPLKRSFSHAAAAPADPQPYHEMVHDLRDDGSRLTASHDHKLLSFRRSQDKSTVVDQHGRVQQLELSAQLHGMFFLSEMPSSATDGSPLQPELTCYRRNLFQISGSFVTPRGPMSVLVADTNQTLPITSMEVTISAIESVDSNPVRLIVIPWKTPPPNSPDVSQTPDQEPPALPLIPFQDNPSHHNNPNAEGEYAVYPVGWRRLQFRIATANNGRRKELQQHFVLHLKVHGTLADNSRVVLTEAVTSPIVVRGRSPRNFQTRKEIPLLGSSAGSRGQALVETGVGVIASVHSIKPEAKRTSLDMQAPRSAFTFGGPSKTASGQPSALRSNSYPSWNQATGSLNQLPATTLGMPSASAFAGDGGELPLASSLAAAAAAAAAGPPPSVSSLTQYGGPALAATENVPRYMDSGRAAKSPRHHQGQSSVHGSISASDSAASDYRYGGSYRMSIGGASDAGGGPGTGYGSDGSVSGGGSGVGGQTAAADYYPPSHNHHHQQQQQQQQQPHHSWTSSSAAAAAEPSSSLVAYSTADRPYAFDRSTNLAARQEATLPAGNLYTPGTKGAFESMNNYSWSTN